MLFSKPVIVMVYIYHLLPSSSHLLLLFTPCPLFLQFPIATSWTKRDFWVDTLLWKKFFLPSAASFLCRSLWMMVYICSLKLGEFLWEEKKSAGGGKRKGEGRLLHMSVAMGILAQWLCSNVAAGMEDLFLQGRLEQKNGMSMSWNLSPQLCRGGYFKKRVSWLYLEKGAASETIDVFILPPRPD